jgi:dTMP kinase
MGAGVLISFEGVDGCGKSTQAALLCERLSARHLPVGPAEAPGSVVREPGGTPAGEAVRDLLLHGPDDLAPWTEALLYAAARAELVQRVVRPNLGAGRILVLDRYIDSSLAYQGHARGLGIEDVLAVNAPAVGGVMPQLTVVLVVDPATGLARLVGDADRIEREGLRLQAQVADGFSELARRFPGRVRLVDGTKSIDEVAQAVDVLVGPLLEGHRV